MQKKEIKVQQFGQKAKEFTSRWVVTLAFLGTIWFITHISVFSPLGIGINGKSNHSYLDYPNEISSKNAIELSKFMQTLNESWPNDIKVHRSFENDCSFDSEKCSSKEINLNDPHERVKVVQSIAKDMGLPASVYPETSKTFTSNRVFKNDFKNKMGIAFPPDYLKHKAPPKAHVPKCITKTFSHKKSNMLYVSPTEFTSLNIKLDGMFSNGGRINIMTAEINTQYASTKDIVFNLTLASDSDDLINQVSFLEVNDNRNRYTGRIKSIQIDHYRDQPLNQCLLYNLDIIFPQHIKTYDSVNIKVNHANYIGGDLKDIMFRNFTVGSGRGSIDLKNLKSDNTMLGTLNGMIAGNYLPVQTLGIASIKGLTRVQVTPQSSNLQSTLVSLDGPVKAIVSTKYGTIGSKFIAHCWMCTPFVESSIYPKYVYHTFYSKRKSIKKGYFKERKANAQITIHSRIGEVKLMYDV